MLSFLIESSKKLRREHTGVTLIELLVVVAIIGVIATIGFVALSGSTESANDTKRINDVSVIQRALDISRVQNSGKYEDLVRTVKTANNECLAVGSATLAGSTQTKLKELLPVIPNDPTTGQTYHIQIDAGTGDTFTKYRVIAKLDNATNRPSSHLATMVGTTPDLGVATANATGTECDCSQTTNYCVGGG